MSAVCGSTEGGEGGESGDGGSGKGGGGDGDCGGGSGGGATRFRIHCLEEYMTGRLKSIRFPL